MAPIKGLRKIVSRYETCPLPLPLWRWDIIIRSKFREWRRAWTRGIHDIRSDIFSKGVARDGWREYGENVSIEKVQSGGAINARQNGYNDVLITGFHRGMEIREEIFGNLWLPLIFIENQTRLYVSTYIYIRGLKYAVFDFEKFSFLSFLPFPSPPFLLFFLFTPRNYPTLCKSMLIRISRE